jgi:DNA-binding transcriptional LysR family regulator
VDLDLRHVRAFVAVADHGHFGRAARALFITQQALSKRVAGLETQVGSLIERQPGGASLTERGERLLPAARGLLEAADHALAVALNEPGGTLRVDIWGPVDPPEALVRAFAAAHPDAVVEVSRRSNLPAALDALRRHELDAVLGDIAHLKAPLGDDLSARLVALTPLAGLVSEPATVEQLTPDDLRRQGLAVPEQPSRAEFAAFICEFAATIGAPTTTETRSAHLDGLVERVGTDAITLIPGDWAPPDAGDVAVVPIRPAPLFPWYVVWRTRSPRSLVHRLVRFLDEHADREEAEGWLPAAARGEPAAGESSDTMSIARQDAGFGGPDQGRPPHALR